MEQQAYKVRTPLFPPYSTVRHLLGIMPGAPKSEWVQMISDIFEQTGTPQNPVDWSDPDRWITERLSGSSAALAQRVWEESRHEVNPRYTRGTYLFNNNHVLLEPDNQGIYQVTDRGAAFQVAVGTAHERDDSGTTEDLATADGEAFAPARRLAIPAGLQPG